MPILIVTIYHMIEWIKWAVLLTTVLVDANMIKLFYFLHLNVIFGFFAMIIGIIQGFSATKECVEAQAERARYLTLQIVCIILFIPLNLSWAWYMKFKGKFWLHEQWIDEGDDDEDD